MKKARSKNGGLPYNFPRIAELRETGVSYEEISEKLSLDGGKKISADAVRKSHRRGLSYLQASGQGSNVPSKLRHKTIIMGPACGCPGELHSMLAIGAFYQLVERPLLKLEFDSAVPALDRWFGADFQGEAADFSQVRQRLAAYQPRNCDTLIRLGSWFTTTDKISSIIRGIKLDEEARGADVILVQVIDQTTQDYAPKLKKWIVDPRLPSEKVIFAPREMQGELKNLAEDFDIKLLSIPVTPGYIIEAMYRQRPGNFYDYVTKTDFRKVSSYLHFVHIWKQIIVNPNWGQIFGEVNQDIQQKLDIISLHYPNLAWFDVAVAKQAKSDVINKIIAKFGDFFKYVLAGDEENILICMRAFVEEYTTLANISKFESAENAEPTD